MSELLPLLHDILARLGNIESNLGISSAGGAEGKGATELPRSIRALDAMGAEKLDPFTAACEKLGGDAAVAGAEIKTGWELMRAFLLRASACKQPSAADLRTLFTKEFAPPINNLKTLATKRGEWENHCKACFEAIGFLNWLVVTPAPRDYVESLVGASDYYANNVRKAYKATNPDHIAFCDTLKQLLIGLMDYIKEFHTTGVSWNPRGVEIGEYSAGGSASTASAPVPAAAASAPAAAPRAQAAAPVAASAPAASNANLFAELNKGGGITAGLKTVTKDMQTWRAEYKAEGPTPSAPSAAPKKAPASAAAAGPKGPPKLEFQAGGNKWAVENQTDAVEVTIGDLKESVYVFGCVGATINVSGKCKSIIVDSCKRTKVFFDNAFASCEVVNCQRMQIHCRTAVGSVAIDKTDGIIVFLPESSLDSKIVASKSSEMNLTWPDAAGNLIERPIPEQYVHQITPGRDGITAEVSDLYGH